MNKIAIPAVLLSIVMIAGVFAFMPTQEASTVHTTILAATPEPFAVTTAAVAAGAGGELTATFTCTTGQTCVIYDAIVRLTVNPGATDDVFHIEAVTVNGVILTGAAALTAPTNDEPIQAATGATIGIAADLIDSTTFADNVPGSALQTVAAVAGESGSVGPVTLNSGETMLVQVQMSGGDDSTSTVTFYGMMTGGAAPATPGYE